MKYMDRKSLNINKILARKANKNKSGPGNNFD